MPKSTKVNYLSNKNLLQIIWSEKLRRCYHLDDAAQYYDVTCHRLEDVAQHVGKTVRLMTFAHIPKLETPRNIRGNRNRPSANEAAKYPTLTFPPFCHYRVDQDGNAEEVLRSHWVGGFTNGHFSDQRLPHGREYAKAVLMLTERYANKPNFRFYSYIDEMMADAILVLTANGLRFDDTTSNNPFAYWTTCVTNAFKRKLNQEKKVQQLRDDLLIAGGAAHLVKDRAA